jgi:hypothetical protein
MYSAPHPYHPLYSLLSARDEKVKKKAERDDKDIDIIVYIIIPSTGILL